MGAVSVGQADRDVAELASRLGLILSSTADAILGLNPEGEVIFANDAALTLLGRDEEDVIGAALHDLVHPDEHCDEAACALRGLVAWRDTVPFDGCVWQPDGSRRLVEGALRSTGERTSRTTAVATLRDVTEERREAQAHAEARQRFEVAFDAAPIGMALLTLEGHFLKVNRALSQLTGYDAATLEAGDAPAIVHPEDQGTEARLRAGLVEEGGVSEGYRTEQRFITAEGDIRWVRVSTSLVRTSQGEPSYLIAQIEDITGRRRAEEMLTHRALHDVLTGCANRTLMMDRLRHSIEATARTGHPIALIAVDLDRFKGLNDRFGHEIADEVLVRTAERLRALQRPGDTLARIAADEFVVICVEVDDRDEAELLAHRLQQAVSEPLVVGEHEIALTASVGVVVADEADEAERLLRDAMAAVRHAKQRGRARVEVFDDALREQATERIELEGALAEALARDELSVAFQPIVDLATGRSVGAEALTRWRHPDLGLLGPTAFMDIAEESGLIIPIGLWVLNESCRHVAQWREETGTDVFVSVNLSAHQLTRAGLVDTITRLLDSHELPPSALRLEITETVLVEAGSDSLPDLASLRARGVRVGIDDFGTGYASMSYLKWLPVDFLKIDRSFVGGVGVDHDDTAIVQATIALGQALGLTTVAEGVETAAQGQRLRRLGCHYAQGYLYGRPQQIGDLIAAEDPLVVEPPPVPPVSAVRPGRG